VNKHFVWFIGIFLGIALLLPAQSAPTADTEIQAFVTRVKTALEGRNIPAYLEVMNPEFRVQEEARIRSMFEDFLMEEVLVFPASIQRRTDGVYLAYLRLLFQNSYAVVLDLWRLEIVRNGSDWRIRQTAPTGGVRMLYKLDLPTDRVVRASSVVVRHEDIRLTFQNALCFYDNIPNLETALIVIGDGRLHFKPSHPREQHQLELVFKKPFLEDRLEYAYLRVSDSFFNSQITIVPEKNDSKPVTRAEINKAYSLFTKYYPRSFTIQNSLNGELLSVLPQGEEALFEISGKKVGDLTYVFSPFSEDEINLYQWEEDRILNLYSPPLGEGKKRLFISFGQKYDVLHYDIDIDFKPNQRFFAGKARILVESKVGLLDSLKFKLNPNLQILRISNDRNRELYYAEDKLRQSVYIYFLRPRARGQSTSVDIYYRGRIDPPPVATDVVETGQEGTTLRLADIRLETFLYSRSSLWYPAPDNVDFFTARIKFITPPGFQVVSNGIMSQQYAMQELKDVEDVGKMGNTIQVYEAQKPVKYLSFVVGRLSRRNQEAQPVPVEYYRGSQTLLESWDVFNGARDILTFYQGLFGDFPYEKLSIIRRVWGSAGGHSPASFIVLNELPETISQNLRPTPSSPVDFSRWKEYFLAHEIAHQWWGQGMAWATYRDQWISEGMSQFAAVLYLRHKYGEKAFSQILSKLSRTTNKHSQWGAISMGSRISYFNFPAYQSIVYNKASLVLNMLRDLLGDEVFFSTLRRYYARHRFSAARSSVVFRAFRDISPLDLTGFFEMWFNSYLLPNVRITHTSHAVPQGGYRLQIRIEQTGSPFMFPLWVEWRENGRTVRRMIVVEGRSTQVEFNTGYRPEKLKFNPEKAVPGKFTIK
jgi:hypothetical protein